MLSATGIVEWGINILCTKFVKCIISCYCCRSNTSHYDSVVDTQLFVDRFKENTHFVHEESQLFGEEPYDCFI